MTSLVGTSLRRWAKGTVVWFLGVGVLCGSVAAQQPAPLKIASWNMAWLTDRLPGADGDAGVPPNIYHRTKADYDLVAKYVRRLNADVVAFQEVDGTAVAAKVFDPKVYELHATDEPDVQRPGFAVRKGISFQKNPDFVELDVIADQARSLRRGADITLKVNGQDIRLLAVHLKSGCPRQPLGSGGANCPLLKRQLPILKTWIDQRIAEGTPFIVLGDYNRILADSDDFWETINQGGSAGLRRSTANQTSACWGGKHPQFIDHMVMGGAARFWFSPSTFTVLEYDETAPSFEQKISDHCPQSADFNVGGKGPFMRTW